MLHSGAKVMTRTFCVGIFGLAFFAAILLLLNVAAPMRWFSKGDQEMAAQIGSAEGLLFVRLETNWTMACVATSYCGAERFPKLPATTVRDICGNFPDDNLWGVAFLSDGKLVSVIDMSRFGKITITDTCYLHGADPRLVAGTGGHGTVTVATSPNNRRPAP
jgi:hypothetical protein